MRQNMKMRYLQYWVGKRVVDTSTTLSVNRIAYFGDEVLSSSNIVIGQRMTIGGSGLGNLVLYFALSVLSRYLIPSTSVSFFQKQWL